MKVLPMTMLADWVHVNGCRPEVSVCCTNKAKEGSTSSPRQRLLVANSSRLSHLRKVKDCEMILPSH